MTKRRAGNRKNMLYMIWYKIVLDQNWAFFRSGEFEGGGMTGGSLMLISIRRPSMPAELTLATNKPTGKLSNLRQK